MGAQGSQSGISYRKEVTWGVVDPGQFTGVNFSEEDMAFNIENKISNNIRPDRQTNDLVQVGADTSGGFKFELVATNIDGMLPAFLFDSDWHAPVQPIGTVSFAVETAPGVGGKITMTALSVAALSVGQFATFGGATNAANRGTFRIIGIVGTAVQVNSPLATEAGVTLTVKGDRIRNGVTKSSFSIERSNNDISRFFLYKGMVPNVLELELEAGEPVVVGVSFVGKDEVLGNTTASSPAATSPPITKVINAVSSVGQIAIDGVAVDACLLQTISISYDNKVEGKTAVGTLGFCNADPKAIELTGKISLYFSDSTYYTKYRNSTSFSISIMLQDIAGNTYTFYIPAAKFDEMTANVTGKDDDVLLEGSYVGIIGAEGFTFQITRALA